MLSCLDLAVDMILHILIPQHGMECCRVPSHAVVVRRFAVAMFKLAKAGSTSPVDDSKLSRETR